MRLGIGFCRNDGKFFGLCSSKYHKNFTHKRNPRKVPWTKAFRKAHGKELTIDSSLSLEARRNVPVRYSREHVATTLRAMDRVKEIRARRERAFYKIRMGDNKERMRMDNAKLVAEMNICCQEMCLMQGKRRRSGRRSAICVTQMSFQWLWRSRNRGGSRD